VKKNGQPNLQLRSVTVTITYGRAERQGALQARRISAYRRRADPVHMHTVARDDGFTLIELLISITITVLVAGR
jgi:prepilin-type N-terminal cleavage/methylation domain-containing protein